MARTNGVIAVLGGALTLAFTVPISVSAAFAPSLDQRFDGALRIGIGINTGVVIAGTIGGGGELEFTLIGDTVNVAACVEQLTKTAGDAILLTRQSVDALVSRPPELTDRGSGQAVLELSHRQLVATLRAGWSLTGEAPAAGEERTPAALADAGDVLHQCLHAVSAALLTRDARPVAETFAWTADLMQNRGVDIARLRELGELLKATLLDYPLAQGLVEQHFAGGLRRSPR